MKEKSSDSTLLGTISHARQLSHHFLRYHVHVYNTSGVQTATLSHKFSGMNVWRGGGGWSLYGIFELI